MQKHNSTRVSTRYDYDPLVLLNLRRLPARVSFRGAAALLNFEPVAVRTLVALGFLKPLGGAKGSEHKYFSTASLLKLSNNEKWLHEVTRALSKFWAGKNARREIHPVKPKMMRFTPRSRRPE